MKEYPKIQSVYKRDPRYNYTTFLTGEFSLPEFEYLQNNEWIFDEKVDGTNIRVIWDPKNKDANKHFHIEGKTDRAKTPRDLVDNISNIFADKLDKIASKFPEGVCFYGEGYGTGIQKGGKYRDDKSFVLFDVRVGEWWLEHNVVREIAKELNIDVVPIVGTGTLHDAIAMTKDGFKSQWGDFEAEGLILRPSTTLKSRSGRRIISKVKCTDF